MPLFIIYYTVFAVYTTLEHLPFEWKTQHKGACDHGRNVCPQ